MPIYPHNKTNLGNTKNNSGKFKSQPKFLVMHYTAAGSGMASAKYLFGPHKPESSAHFVVDRNGDVIQIADTNLITWHAGRSLWRGISGLNSHAIGVELANYGYARKGVSFVSKVRARHKNGGPEQDWETYPEKQVQATIALAQWIVEKHPSIREVVGHDDIAPGRKSDPGPAAPMDRFKSVLMPDSDMAPVAKRDKFKVNASSLIVRGGPGTQFGKLRSLETGTIVTVLQDKGEWSYIEDAKGQGWVFDQYLSLA